MAKRYGYKPVKGFCSASVFFYADKKKAIASSTKATSDLLALLKEECSSWEELKSKIHFDDDAIKVVEAYEKLGVSFESVRWK